MNKELSVTCPLCGIPRFSAKGLRAHRCKSSKRKPLSKKVWSHAVDAAKRELVDLTVV